MSSIDPATDIFDWGNSLEDKNVHEQIHLLKNKIKPRIFFTTIFLKKLLFIMINIHRALIMKLEK